VQQTESSGGQISRHSHEPLAVGLFGLIQRLDVYGDREVMPRVFSSIMARGEIGGDAAGEVE